MTLTQENAVIGDIGLPENQPDLPVQLFQAPTLCASHSVAKAIFEILNELGHDSKQQTVISALLDTIQPKKEAKDPDEFNEKKIKIAVSKKLDARIKGDIELEI